ncbi:MAG: DUF3793 family protein [Romboutsia sp.]|uniref:DUF3793 family protein n=1 Tax=Romboutsia sp. TaxID=1965302 RepID=UPI003F407A98
MKVTCKHNCCKNKSNSSYIKWILGVLGPVILGSKASEILNISSIDIHKEEKIRDIESFFKNCFKISYKFITMNDGGVRILFVNKSSLSKVLDNKKCINFLKFIGYPSNITVDEYIDILVNKLHSNEFPHEIGIFLGYPLKDVVGFMGYGNYKFHETKSWRIYGEPDVSYEIYNKFLRDKNKIKELIDSNSSLEDLVNII